MKIYTKEILQCWQCANKLKGINYFCAITFKNIKHPCFIPKWCPLPDKKEATHE